MEGNVCISRAHNWNLELRALISDYISIYAFHYRSKQRSTGLFEFPRLISCRLRLLIIRKPGETDIERIFRFQVIDVYRTAKKQQPPSSTPLKKKERKKKSDRNIRSKIKKKKSYLIQLNIAWRKKKPKKKEKKNINIFQSFFSHFISLISFDYPRNILDADKKSTQSCLRNSNENFERQIHPYSLWNFRYVIFFPFLHLREY